MEEGDQHVRAKVIQSPPSEDRIFDPINTSQLEEAASPQSLCLGMDFALKSGS
jgi:hypothetical protein